MVSKLNERAATIPITQKPSLTHIIFPNMLIERLSLEECLREVESVHSGLPECGVFPPDRQPGPLYWANLLAEEFIVVNQGGTSSAKTYGIMAVLLTLALSHKGHRILVAGGTMPKLREDAVRVTDELISCSSFLQSCFMGLNKNEMVYTFNTGSFIEFKSFEGAESAKGGKRDVVYFSEATRIDWGVFYELYLRATQKIFIDYNPTFRFWVHEKLLGKRSAEFGSVKVIRSWHIHNRYLSDEQRMRIEGISDDELWKVYARGVTGALTGLVYYWGVRDWPAEAELAEVIWGVDWGFTNDPTVVCRVGVLLDGGYVVDQLCYAPGIEPEVLAVLMKENGYRTTQWSYADHHKDMIYRCRLQGVMLRPAEKGAGSVMPRTLYCKSKQIWYTPRSKDLAGELMAYRFVELKTGDLSNKAIGPDHAIDAATYAIYTHRFRVGRVRG